MNHSETTTCIAEKVHDVILYDIWFNKKLNSRVNEYGQSPPVHVPSSIRVVDNIRIKNLWLNPCPVHLALLSFRAFHGEFDCPIDKVWAYRFAQATVSLDPFFCFAGGGRYMDYHGDLHCLIPVPSAYQLFDSPPTM